MTDKYESPLHTLHVQKQRISTMADYDNLDDCFFIAKARIKFRENSKNLVHLESFFANMDKRQSQ